MASIVAGILSVCKSITAIRDLVDLLVREYTKAQLASLDSSVVEAKRDLEYVIALKEQAIKERNDEKVIRAHRLYIQLLSRM